MHPRNGYQNIVMPICVCMVGEVSVYPFYFHRIERVTQGETEFLHLLVHSEHAYKS